MNDKQSLDAAPGAWPDAGRAGPRLGGGFRNAVWEVRAHGIRCVARRNRRTRDELDWELDLLAFLDEAGMYVPRAVPAADGSRHVDGVVIFTWLDGEPPASVRDWHAVAAELNRLHELTRQWPQRPGFCSTQELLSRTSGGDVQLDRMPDSAVQRCRTAWQALAGERVTVVHGDPGAANIRMLGGQPGFLDWDEARVDVPLLDFATLPMDLSDQLGAARFEAARRALDAWEAANGWILEPAYAQRRLAGLTS